MIRKLRFLLSTLCCLAFINSHAQVTRGWQPGEIYLSSSWYYNEQNQLYSGIFYSKDNGRTLGLCYKSLENTDSMPVGELFRDATLGVLYNSAYSGLYRSFNYGKNWEYIVTPGSNGHYACGILNGEIYKSSANYEGTIWHSIDTGNTFIPLCSNRKYNIVGGFLEGEILGLDGYDYGTFKLYRSTDYCVHFDTIDINPEVGGGVLSGNYPTISVGTTFGELYLVTWHLPAIYKIFKSTDYGHHFNLQYISDTCDFFFEGYDFTAGNAPGSFYIVKYDSRYWGGMTEVTISYSSDSAKTFTSNVHHLDANWVDTAWNSVYYPDKQNIISISQNFPNPFSVKTTFQYNVGNNEKNVCLEIFNLNGELIQIIPMKNFNKSTQVDLTFLQNGIYIYRLKTSSFISKPCKLIKN